MSVELRTTIDGSRPLTEGELRSISTRGMQAAARETARAHRTSVQTLVKAEARNRTGRYERSLLILPPKKVGDSWIAGVVATAPYAEALEKGRRGFVIRPHRAKALLLPGGLMRASAKVGPAEGRHWMERGIALAAPEVRRINEKWAAVIASGMKGRAV